MYCQVSIDQIEKNLFPEIKSEKFKVGKPWEIMFTFRFDVLVYIVFWLLCILSPHLHTWMCGCLTNLNSKHYFFFILKNLFYFKYIILLDKPGTPKINKPYPKSLKRLIYPPPPKKKLGGPWWNLLFCLKFKQRQKNVNIQR